MPLALILALLLQTQATSTELHYSFTLPAGLTPFPEAKASSPDLVDCWTETTTTSQTGGVVLCIQRMHALLPRDVMKPSDVPAPSRLVGLKWKTFDIQGIATSTTQNGEPVFALVAQVPLAPEAIQVAMSSTTDQEPRVRQLMDATLATLEGETNWLSDADRSGRLGKAAGAWIAIGIGVAVVLWIRKRKTAQA